MLYKSQLKESELSFDEPFNKNKINIQKMYDKYNDLCFNGELPEIPLKYSMLKNVGGKVTATGNKNNPETWVLKSLEISLFTEKTVGQFLGLLLHEMIHVKFFHERIMDIGGMHGLKFKEEVRRLNKMNLGFVVPIEEDISTASVSSDVKKKPIVLVLVFKKGEIKGIQIYAQKAVNDILETYTRYPIRWWESTGLLMQMYYSDNPYFAKYPVLQKPKKGGFSTYPIVDETMSEAIKNTIENKDNFISKIDISMLQENKKRNMLYKSSLKEYEDYVGSHQAPTKDDDVTSPLYDVTLNGTYPEDIYSANGLRYYGDGQAYDRESISVIYSARNKPNMAVKIYRAIPSVLTNEEQISEYIKQKAYIMKTGKIPKGVDNWGNRSEYYEFISNEIDRLQALPDNSSVKPTINRGDWVSISRTYAKEHGHHALNGKFRILTKTVKASQIWTDGNSINEWGYDA